MQTIRDLLSRDLSQQIEEVIKVDQQDEATVYREITEYVATDRIKRQYRELLKAIADGPSEPTEGVGVWISGFFGSGKSSFAKNLGYILADTEVQDEAASQLFIRQLEQQDPKDRQVETIRDLLSYINSRLDTQVLMFDVQVDRAVRRATEPIAEIMYTVLLRELDYAKDYDIAALEIELEAEGRLGDFVRTCAQLYGELRGHPAPVPVTLPDVDEKTYSIWRQVRKGAQRVQRASAVLHHLDPQTYPNEDSWAGSLQAGTAVTIRTLVDHTFELTARRRPDHAIVYIIDEVGQYVARSGDKIENLRAVVEHFGQESKNRVQRGQAVAPVWVIVTSQEKLDEVVAAIDDKRVNLARLQDRFKHRIDMAPADIREVATRRVLAKIPEAEQVLEQLYEDHKPILHTRTRLERTERPSKVSKAEFVQFYPYLPYFIDLSIDIVSGMRLQSGAPRHIGGSNRTIIKQAYEMLVSERTGLADAPVGTLVTLDRIYDLIEGNLPSEKQKDISDIERRWPGDPWPGRVAKAIALLEPVRGLPRTEENLAALLYRRLGNPSPLPEVERAVKLLEPAQFIRPTENGWKLQTAQEKSWMAERNALSPTPKEQHGQLADALRAIFSDIGLTYRHHNLRTFRVGVTWDSRPLTSGRDQIQLQLRIADGPEVFADACDRARDDSRADAHKNELFWVISMTPKLDELDAELCRSKTMVSRYSQLRAENKITKEELTSLSEERQQVNRLQARLQERLKRALVGGRGFFRGVAKEGAALGKTFSSILKGLLRFAVPDLYPKLEMGAKPLKGNEAEEILKAANLTGLPKIFYGPPDGLDLVTKEGDKYVVNQQAAILKEVSSFLEREHSYGNRVTGRTLEDHFGGLGYGWEREMLWLVMATLLRGAAIQVTYQGRRYRNHLDPQVRPAFSGTNAFRGASFAPRKSIDLRTLVKAAKRYEQLTGEEVDVEEVAIAQAFQALARQELEALLPVEATASAHHIPVDDVLREYHQQLDTVLNSASDDCVRTLAGEGATFQELRDRVAEIRRATSQKGLAVLQRMRRAVRQIWPILQTHLDDSELTEQVELLEQQLATADYYPTTSEVDAALHLIEETYRQRYQALHKQRHQRFEDAADAVRAQPAWLQVPEDMQESVLKPLTDRMCEEDLTLPSDALSCPTCGTSLSEMESHLSAVDALRSRVLMRVQELVTPDEKVERVRLSSVVGVGQTLESEEDVEEVLEQLKDHLLKLVAAGVKVVLE
jgi:hypothetical protein